MAKVIYQFSLTSLAYFSLMAAYVASQAVASSAPAAHVALGN